MPLNPSGAKKDCCCGSSNRPEGGCQRRWPPKTKGRLFDGPSKKPTTYATRLSGSDCPKWDAPQVVGRSIGKFCRRDNRHPAYVVVLKLSVEFREKLFHAEKNDASCMASPRNAADAVPEVHARASLCALHRSAVNGAGDCPPSAAHRQSRRAAIGPNRVIQLSVDRTFASVGVLGWIVPD